MTPHESRDLDDVIDDVARAMTSCRLERDLRPAIAARREGVPSWWMDWRLAATVALVAFLVGVAVMPRSGGEPPPTQRAAVPDDQPVVTAPDETRTVPGPVTAEPRSARQERRVARQTIVRTAGTEDVVIIPPVAIVPLEEDLTPPAQTAPQIVTIAPIDVEPVRIRTLGEQVE
jgi:hypothetical protein